MLLGTKMIISALLQEGNGDRTSMSNFALCLKSYEKHNGIIIFTEELSSNETEASKALGTVEN